MTTGTLWQPITVGSMSVSHHLVVRPTRAATAASWAPVPTSNSTVPEAPIAHHRIPMEQP